MTLHRYTYDPRYAHLNFPKPVRLGPNMIGYIKAESDDYLAARVAERDARLAEEGAERDEAERATEAQERRDNKAGVEEDEEDEDDPAEVGPDIAA